MGPEGRGSGLVGVEALHLIFVMRGIHIPFRKGGRGGARKDLKGTWGSLVLRPCTCYCVLEGKGGRSGARGVRGLVGTWC